MINQITLQSYIKMSKDSELSVVQNIKDNQYDIRCIINDTEPYTLYCAIDIAKTIGIKKITSTIRNFDKNEKTLTFYDTNGKQNTSFLTYKGLLKLICISRKLVCDNFAKTIGVNIRQTKFNSIEIETLQHIKTAFGNEEIIFQYQVGKYKIDLYFPKHKLAIECDEEQHNKLNELYDDNQREENIKELIKDCIFIRYKPYDKDFNIFKLINNIYIHIISSKFKYYRYC